ncbi:WW domain-containing protein [Fusarium sp. LHS14.1]|nr:WW domain-containing protein [Fusarium sp. LHS14.1]
MSFLNKFKKEFEGLNLGERLQQQQNVQTYQNHQAQGYQHNDNYQNNQGYHNNKQDYGGYQNSNQPYPVQSSNGQQGGYQPYNGQQSYAGQQSYHQGGSDYNPSQALQPQQQHRPTSSQGFSLPVSSANYGQGAQPLTNGPPCPTPPRWIAYWSENDRQWCYAETTGRSMWQAPSDPLPGMPSYPGSLSMNRGHEGQMQPSQTRPSLKEEKSSSNMILAAAGGFAAGGVAGYFVKDRIDKHKAKKRHGCVPADFADFAEYPDMKVDLECNVCNQDISGPYAHCKKCAGGDWDVCRDCIAQGETCDGNGEHNLVKVYPKYSCDICDQMIRGDFYHCAWCNDGDWDTCQRCIDKGYTCKAPDNTKHDLVALYIPNLKFGKGGRKKENSSDSETDSD